MKKQILLTIAAMLLPMSMMAQTPIYGYHKDTETQLEYIYLLETDPTDPANQMIYVGSNDNGVEGDPDYFSKNAFIPDGSLRSQWRRYLLCGGNDAESKATQFWPRLNSTTIGRQGLDQVTKITSSVNSSVRIGKCGTYQGVEYFINLEELEVRSEIADNAPDAKAVLDLSGNRKLRVLTFVTTSDKDGRFKYIDVSHTKLVSLEIPQYSADILETLKLEDLSTLTSLTFRGSADFTKLLRLDISQTGLTGSLNLSRLTALNRITIDASKTPRSGITLHNNDTWVLKHKEGNVETWVCPNDVVNVEIWVDEEPSTDINLAEYVKMKTLIIHGEATSILLPESALTNFSIDVTDCPNVPIDWNGNESTLTKLTLKNVASFDATDFTNLIVLRYLEPASANLTLPAGNIPLRILDITRSSLTELDLYDDDGGTVIAPNLTTVKTWYAPLTLLDLSYHTKLLSAPYPSSKNMSPFGHCEIYVDVDEDGDHFVYQTGETEGSVTENDPDKWPGLNMVPSPYSQIVYYAEHAEHEKFENGINSVEELNDFVANNQTLKKVILKGCTSLTNVHLSHGFDEGKAATAAQDLWVYYNSIEEVDMTGCTGMIEFKLRNSMLKSLKLDGCIRLEGIDIDQGLLRGENNDISTQGCKKLKVLIAKRQHWQNLDFFLSPDYRDIATEIAKIQQIQVNGGSYTLQRTTDGTTFEKFIRLDENNDPMKYTCQLRHIDLSNLTCWDGVEEHDGLRRLLVDCNLLTELDLSVVGPGLKQLQCTNNMLTTLDLTPLTESVKNGILELRSCNWKYQVGFESAEVVKGNWDSSTNNWMTYDNLDDELANSGAHDWVALHIEEEKGYTHSLDGNLKLYHNLYDARANDDAGKDEIASESDPWMCKVSEIDLVAASELPGADKFVQNSPCPSNHVGQHIFLHSQSDIKEDNNGKTADQDLMNKVMTYKFKTGFLLKKVANEISGKLDGVGDGQPDDYSLIEYPAAEFDYENAAQTYYDDPTIFQEEIEGDPPTYVSYTKDELLEEWGHIVIRMHLGSYILNVSTTSKNQFSAEKAGVDYFSSTIYLDFDALIPNGVSVWCIKGPTEDGDYDVHGTPVDGQLDMVQFGGDGSVNGPDGRENRILPAFTPVYVRAKTPQPAGLYAFKAIRDKDLKGWENLRGENMQHDYILHGMESVNSGEILDQNVAEDYPVKLQDAYDHAKAIVDGMSESDNILEGYGGIKYPTTDINDELFNKYSESTRTNIPKRTILTLGTQNQKKGYPLIGFWPYNGTTIGAHRCYIPFSNIYGTTTSSTAKGFNFFFSKEVLGETTGIKTVNEKVADENVWYNMQGVRLNKRPTQHGVYIHNGQKVMIK